MLTPRQHTLYVKLPVAELDYRKDFSVKAKVYQSVCSVLVVLARDLSNVAYAEIRQLILEDLQLNVLNGTALDVELVAIADYFFSYLYSLGVTNRVGSLPMYCSGITNNGVVLLSVDLDLPERYIDG